MNSLASRLAPKAVQKLMPYQSARRIGGSGHLWLNANELEKKAVAIVYKMGNTIDIRIFCHKMLPALIWSIVVVRGRS